MIKLMSHAMRKPTLPVPYHYIHVYGMVGKETKVTLCTQDEIWQFLSSNSEDLNI